MAQVVFSYKGTQFSIQCNRYDKMRDIFQKFFIKSYASKNSVYFIYSGNSVINDELTFEQIANRDDKNRNKMNIIVIEKNNSSISYHNFNSIDNNTQNISGNPLIFEALSELNKRYDKLENDIKKESKIMRKRIEDMKYKLMKIEKKRIRFEDATYYGQTIGLEISGLGIIENDNRNKYEGEMLKSDRSGIGIFYQPNGVFFYG